MAIVLQFKQGDSGTTLNLNAGETGFQLAGDGWNPAVATPVHMGDPPPIGESIHLRLAHSSHDNIATSVQSLHEMQVLADRYINDPTQETPVWLHAKMANETGERRALVHSITIQYKTSWFGAPATALDIPLVITVVRGPYWESTTARNLPDGAPSAAASVTYNYTAAGDVVAAHDIVGDGARIRLLDIYNNFNLHRYWMGIRSAGKHGATGVSNFVNVWECEDGVNNSVESGITDEVDATASGGDRVTVSETDLDWDDGNFHNCIYILLGNVTNNEADQWGDFLWLLRAKVTAGTWETRLGFSVGVYMADSGNDIKTDIVEVSDTDWGFYEMGVKPISLRNIHTLIEADYSKSLEHFYRIDIYARRTSGAGNFYLDCLCPIPIDEGFLKIEGKESSTDEHVLFGHSPEGVKGSISFSGGNLLVQTFALMGVQNFTLPPGDGRIICVYSQKAGGADTLTNTIKFNDGDTGRYYERWLSLRGSE